jgi:hypothetical protein
MGSFSSLRRVAVAAGISFALLSGLGSGLAHAGDKLKDKYEPKPICKVAPVPLPSALPAGLVLFGAVGVVAYRGRQKTLSGL